jgi:O-methyltransferase
VRYVQRNSIDGDVVECGVWRGGSMMAVALCLVKTEDFSRSLYLYDTYEGMPRPGSVDKDASGRFADEMFSKVQTHEDGSTWCAATYEEVRTNLLSTGYPESRIHFVKGKVENTLPLRDPRPIALLRLDTDWYESTRCELEHLYSHIAPDGILIIDDYGNWQGCRRAVDEFFNANSAAPFMHRIDYTGRLLIKTGNVDSQRKDRSRWSNVTVHNEHQD